MISDNMNEAINLLRPRVYPFTQVKLSTLNVFKGLEKVQFEGQCTDEEMQYQYVCAQALNKIFYWNKLEWGKIAKYTDIDEQTKNLILRQEENSIAMDFMQEKWVYY